MKKKLERIQKRLGNKVILRLQRNKNPYNKLLKKSISLAKSEFRKRNQKLEDKDGDQIARAVLKDTIEDLFQMPLQSLTYDNF